MIETEFAAGMLVQPSICILVREAYQPFATLAFEWQKIKLCTEGGLAMSADLLHLAYRHLGVCVVSVLVRSVRIWRSHALKPNLSIYVEEKNGGCVTHCGLHNVTRDARKLRGD